MAIIATVRARASASKLRSTTMRYKQPELSAFARSLDAKSFNVSVHGQHRSTTIIRLRYTEPFVAETHLEVKSPQTVYDIYHDHASGDFLCMVPNQTCPNQRTPEPADYEIDRQGCIRHETLDDLRVELTCGKVHDKPLFVWLADYTERCRFIRLSDILYRVGPVRSQELYDVYGTVAAMAAAPSTDLNQRISPSALATIQEVA